MSTAEKEALERQIDKLKKKVEELEEEVRNLEESLEESERQEEETAQELRWLEESYEGITANSVDNLKEIISQLDYGVPCWRRLDTVEDVLAALKKEVIEC